MSMLKIAMVTSLRNSCFALECENETEFDFSSECAIYWYASDWYDGDADPLYRVLCESRYRPSCLTSGIDDCEDDIAEMMYYHLQREFPVQ
jgi:hypothetical protein